MRSTLIWALIGVSLAAFWPLTLGFARTLFYLPQSLLSDRPVRIDLPLPFVPVDIISVSDPSQIQKVITSAAVGRLHALDTALLPKWVQLYFAATRFHDVRNDTWFVPFEEDTSVSNYAERRDTIVSQLEKGHTKENVQKVAELLRSGATQEQLALYMATMVNARFTGGKTVPQHVVDAAFKELDSLPQAFNPSKFKAAKKSVGEIVDWCAANKDFPEQQLKALDVQHNIAVVSNSFTKTVQTLKASPSTPLEKLFTKPENCPTASASTFDGLLFYPAVPRTTVFLISNSKAAGKTGSLYYTFGTGTPTRACAFLPFWKAFMLDLQAELQGNVKSE